MKRDLSFYLDEDFITGKNMKIVYRFKCKAQAASDMCRIHLDNRLLINELKTYFLHIVLVILSTALQCVFL